MIFTQGSIAGKLLRFMIPILGALVLQAMYGAVDLLVVGQFGTDAGISAVATGSNIINLVTFVITSLTMGVTVVISRFLGERKPERIGKVIGGAVCFFALLSVVLMILLLAFAPVFSSWLNAPEAAFDLTVTYVRICGAGIVFVVAYNVISGIFRGLGNSRLPLIFVAIACVTNIFGDLLFVAAFHMNVAGAAWQRFWPKRSAWSCRGLLSAVKIFPLPCPGKISAFIGKFYSFYRQECRSLFRNC